MTTKDYKTKSSLRIFFSYFRPHRRLFLVDMTCALLVAAIDLMFPLITRTAMSDWLPAKEFRLFFVVMALVALGYLVRSLLNYIICYWGHTFGIRVEADIRRDLFTHMQELGFDFYDHNRTGQLMSRLTSDLFDLTELAHHGPEDTVTSCITIVGALVVMFTVQWRLALVIAVLIPIFALVVTAQRKRMSAVSKEVKQKVGHINTEIESSLSGIRTAKAFANECWENDRFSRANGKYRTSKRQFHKAMARFNSTMEFFLCGLQVVVVAVGGWLIMKNQMDLVDLLTFSLYIGTFINPMRKLANFSEMFASGFAGLSRFREIMATEPSQKDAPDAVTLEKARGRIDVKDVSFAYDGDLAVLHHVSLQVQPGETVAIVGPSGGGKSTLCQLIPRFYDVSQGEILIDGVDVRKIKQKSIHQNIGIVQQDVFLFADTIFENIRYGKPDATPEEVYEAARKAEIYEDIMAMPEGFDTYVGERGALLSGGQKQRVAIARIFLKNPPILILDEATSALDSVTESKIQKAFDNLSKGRTTLIIAHRLSTIRAASRIVSIADGVIQEEGTHDQLLKQGGLYAELYRTQNSQAG
ncbi:MAG: ABC transporter ATP-binding protein [Candidatus Faecousia sp.]|nr:ABC transporter ATP-binding protein/permease [Clostridiales bacterium]MDY4219985.1 ABC transporter ATP-binding protein [Candidatus Faecousia sp.]